MNWNLRIERRGRKQLAALLVFALLTTLFLPGGGPPSIVSAPEEAALPDLDFSFKEVSIRSMGKDGRLLQELSAATMHHYGTELGAQFNAPRLNLYHPSGVVWRAAAQQGKVVERGKILWLLGEVTIERPGPTDTLRLKTSNVRVLPEEHTFETSEAVWTQDTAGSVTAIGMRANTALGRLELLSRVQAQYVAAEDKL